MEAIGEAVYHPQWVEIAGAHNVRDLGGLPAGDRRVRSGVLLRGDHLDDLTPEGLEVVHQRLGLRAVIDLRAPTELPEPPVELTLHGLTLLELPLVDLSGTTSPSALREKLGDDEGAIYRHMLEQAGPPIVRILTFLLEAGHTPSLIHCAAGKDRTGITVAVLLTAAGVAPAAIKADYLATAERLPRIRKSLATRAVYRAMNQGQRVIPMTAIPIEAVLRALDDEPGQVEGFLQRHGAEPTAVQRWRELLLE
jgi:protein-tyrosine phosphatase